MTFPITRLRRLRVSPVIRDLIAEPRITPNSLIVPLFIRSGSNTKHPIETMPGIYQYSIDSALEYIHGLQSLNLKSYLIFGVPDHKDPLASEAYTEDGLIQQAIRAIKTQFPNSLVMTDVCLCAYTPHGHCGVLDQHHGNAIIDNDRTLPLLARMAVSHAKAGADIVAPSSMMDGQVKAIRDLLDDQGLIDTIILSYSAKFASNFYAPFRDAAGSKPEFGDRKTYQMDFRNHRQFFQEVSSDIDEGADMVMVKPALAYLDVIQSVKQKFGVPLAAYCVSGEYGMIKAAAEKGVLNYHETIAEIMTAVHRAGADMIISYWAPDFVQYLNHTR